MIIIILLRTEIKNQCVICILWNKTLFQVFLANEIFSY